MSVHSRSVADLVRSGNVFMDIYWRESVEDERDATRTFNMGLGTIRTLMDDLWMRYRRAMDHLIREGSYGLYGKIQQFHFSITS